MSIIYKTFQLLYIFDFFTYICLHESTEMFFCLLSTLSEEGNDNPLQYSHLENSMDRGAW